MSNPRFDNAGLCSTGAILGEPGFQGHDVWKSDKGEGKGGAGYLVLLLENLEKSLLMGLTEVISLVNPGFKLFKRTMAQPLQRN